MPPCSSNAEIIAHTSKREAACLKHCLAASVHADIVKGGVMEFEMDDGKPVAESAK